MGRWYSTQTYFWDGNVATYEENGQRSFYLQDELGSPLRIEDETGRTRESYGYGVFGEDLYCFLASNFPHFHRYDSLKSALYIHAVSKNINTFPKNQGRIRAAIAVEILDFTVMYR